MIGCFISELQASTSGRFRRTFGRRLRARTARTLSRDREVAPLVGPVLECHWTANVFSRDSDSCRSTDQHNGRWVRLKGLQATEFFGIAGDSGPREQTSSDLQSLVQRNKPISLVAVVQRNKPCQGEWRYRLGADQPLVIPSRSLQARLSLP